MTSKPLFAKGVKITGSFMEGLLAVFRAINLAGRQKGLKKYFIIPFFVNFVILTGLVYFFMHEIQSLVGMSITGTEWYWASFRLFLKVLLSLASLVAIVFIYQFAGGLITAPFNDFLSQRVEENLTGKSLDEKLTLKRLLSDVLRIIGNTAKLLLLLIGVNLFLLLLNLIPAVGSAVYAVLGFLTSSFFLGFQFFDFPLERRRLRFNEKFRIIWKFKFMAAGLGAGFFLIAFIPIVGFLGLNLGTIGGTVLFLDHIEPALSASGRGASAE